MCWHTAIIACFEYPKLTSVLIVQEMALKTVNNMAKILQKRIELREEAILKEEQAGFRKGRGTTEQVFILRNIIEQVNEWQATLYINFIDFEKAFDSIHRDSLWDILKMYQIPKKLIRMIQLFYKESRAHGVEMTRSENVY